MTQESEQCKQIYLMPCNPCREHTAPRGARALLELNSLQSRGAIGPRGKTGGKPTGPSGTRRVPSGLRPCAAIWMRSHSMAYKWRKWSSSLHQQCSFCLPPHFRLNDHDARRGKERERDLLWKEPCSPICWVRTGQGIRKLNHLVTID
jgi:hypothetical protein